MSIMFFMATIPQDHEQALQAVKQLRRVYHNSTVLVYIDGENTDQDFINAARKQTVIVMGAGFNSFEAAMGGALPQTMLDIFLLHSNDSHLIKIDPDTAVLDDLPPVPENDRCIFGRRQHFKRAWSIQGGCMGFTRKAAQILCESALLVDKRLRPPYEGLPENYTEILKRRAECFGLSSFDWTIGWAATELGIEQVDWTEEMYCYHKGPIPKGPWRLIHPFQWSRDFSDG